MREAHNDAGSHDGTELILHGYPSLGKVGVVMWLVRGRSQRYASGDLRVVPNPR